MNNDYEELLRLSERIGEMDWAKDADELMESIRDFIGLLLPNAEVRKRARGRRRPNVDNSSVAFNVNTESADLEVNVHKGDGFALNSKLRSNCDSNILLSYYDKLPRSVSFLEALLPALLMSYCEIVPAPLFAEELLDMTEHDEADTFELEHLEPYSGRLETLSKDWSWYISNTDTAHNGPKALTLRKGRLSNLKSVVNLDITELAPLFEGSLLFNIEAVEWKDGR